MNWQVAQSKARELKAAGDIFGALEQYDRALVEFPTPNKKEMRQKTVLARLEDERNQCQREVWAAQGGMVPHTGPGLMAHERN